MRKVIGTIFALLILFSLCGCGEVQSVSSNADEKEVVENIYEKKSLTEKETIDILCSAIDPLGDYVKLLCEIPNELTVEDIHEFEKQFQENTNQLREITDIMATCSPYKDCSIIWNEFKFAISVIIPLDEQLGCWDKNGNEKYDDKEISELLNNVLAGTNEVRNYSATFKELQEYAEEKNPGTEQTEKVINAAAGGMENFQKYRNKFPSKSSNTSTNSTTSKTSEPTTGQKNALKTAQAYLKSMAFSYTGLIKQLEYEKYTHEEAVYAVDHCGADWKEQAALCAYDYLNSMSFSRQGLIEQLQYEGFTYEQAVYGVEQNGY